MNDIITIQNVRGYLDANGTAWLNAADVARGLGWTQTKNGVEYVRWETLNGYLNEFGFPNNLGKEDFIPENMFYRLVWKSRDDNAQKFQALVADEILPAIRKTGTYSLKGNPFTPFANSVIDIGETARALEKFMPGLKYGIALAQAIALAEANSTFNYEPLKKLLPPAEHETGYMNATQVGEKLGLGKGTVAGRKANLLLKEAGFQYREGRDWRLTDEGTAYGEEMPYLNKGHTGYQIRWNGSVIEAVKEESA